MHGLPERIRPLFIISIAEPWIGESAVIECRNAMSSTHSATWGNRSLTYLPHWPYCLNFHFGPTTRPWFLWPPRPKVFTSIVLPSSGYTLVKDKQKVNFSYRDNLWRGSDLLATGVASFGHISGIHYQNLAEWPDYLETVERGELPLWRGMRPTAHQRLVRELILQLKTGRLEVDYFRRKFGVDVIDHWRDQWRQYAEDELLGFDDNEVTLTRAGLLRADALLPAFFEPAHRGVRYT